MTLIKPSGVRRLFWDIETSPNVVLAWRCGFKLNINPEAIVKERQIITIAYKWEGEKKVHFLTWDKNQDDAAMLRKFMEVVKEADEMVAHFGDSFDLPWFRARVLIQGLGNLPKIKSIDTKAWASKYYYFNSNKLDYLGEILDVGRKLHTGYALWRDIVLDHCPAALARMVRYNIQDVLLLERVYNKLKFCVAPKTHTGVMNGLPKWTDPHTGSKNVIKSKTRVTSTGVVQHQMFSYDTNSYYSISQAAFEGFLDAKGNRGKAKKDQRPDRSRKAG